jgi:hypothetical protein
MKDKAGLRPSLIPNPSVSYQKQKQKPVKLNSNQTMTRESKQNKKNIIKIKTICQEFRIKLLMNFPPEKYKK